MSDEMDLYLSSTHWLLADRSTGGLLGHGERTGDADGESWREVRLLLGEHVGGRSPAIRVIVCGACCYFLDVPWSDVLMSDEVGAAYVRAAFAESYGGITEEWTIALGDAPYGRPRLACAIDTRELLRLDALAHEGVTVSEVVPSVHLVFNRLQRQLSSGHGVLGFEDGEGVSLIRWENGDVVDAVHLVSAVDTNLVDGWLARTELLHGKVGACYWAGPDDQLRRDGWQAIGPVQYPFQRMAEWADKAGT